MTLQNQTQIDTALKEANRRFFFSGYQLLSWHQGRSASYYGGVTSYWDTNLLIQPSTLFDLGSLTKVVFTTSAISRLYERGELKLEDRVDSYLPQFKNTPYGSLTLGQLLSHGSGLIAWFPFFKEKQTDITQIFLGHSVEFLAVAPLTKIIYSDLGFLLIGEILKSRWGSLLELFNREVTVPLSLKNIVFCPAATYDIAATEYCLESQRLTQGEVFDQNTARLGGISTHAGLFASANDLLPWAIEWLKALKGKSHWLKKSTAEKFTKRSQLVPGSTWGYGWDTKSAAFSSAGNAFSLDSFGHLGYPGTSIWIDPLVNGIAILLTNRVHPSRYDERIKRFRPQIHDLIAKAWTEEGEVAWM